MVARRPRDCVSPSSTPVSCERRGQGSGAGRQATSTQGTGRGSEAGHVRKTRKVDVCPYLPAPTKHPRRRAATHKRATVHARATPARPSVWLPRPPRGHTHPTVIPAPPTHVHCPAHCRACAAGRRGPPGCRRRRFPSRPSARGYPQCAQRRRRGCRSSPAAPPAGPWSLHAHHQKQQTAHGWAWGGGATTASRGS